MQGLSQEAPFKYRNAGAKLNPLPNLPTYSYTKKILGYFNHLSCIPFVFVTCKVQEVLTI